MSDDLPPGARLDPRPGKLGAQYVFLTCAACGREFRLLLSQVRHQMRRDILQRTCSRACTAELRRNVSDRARRRRREIVKPKAAPKYPELYDPEWLGQKYCVELLAPEEIAALIGCAVETVERARRRHGIQPIPRALRAALRAGRAARREGVIA